MNQVIGSLESLKATDPEVYQAISAEERRQREKLLLIASENFASPAVLAAQGCLMTNKYAEGYPRKRYYGGCQHVDTVEELAIERAKKIFGAEHVNVQPHWFTSEHGRLPLPHQTRFQDHGHGPLTGRTFDARQPRQFLG